MSSKVYPFRLVHWLAHPSIATILLDETISAH